jgi:hypothetical protein
VRGKTQVARAIGAACPEAIGAPTIDAPRRGGLPRAQLEAMRAAGREILECRRVLQKGGLNLVGEVLRGQGKFYEHNHYPENDVYDAESHAQYYYHAHRGLAGEHGHFHTFLRRRGMPAQAAPLDVPHAEPWPSGDEALAHLIAVSMDVYGEPIGLFAPNRWVAGDTWYPAGDVIAMLERFRIDHAWPSWPLNRWLGAMFVLFRPHIEALLAERDRVVAAWRPSLAGEDVLERRDLEILAQLPVSVEENAR